MEVLLEYFKLFGEVGGLAGLVIMLWMVDRYLLVRDLRAVNEKMITVIEGNAKALSELSTLVNIMCQKM